jgi:hypothetical protein
MTEPVDMQAAVDRLAVAIGHSVLIEDIGQYPVWWSTVGAVDRTRMRTILNRHVDPAAAAVIARFKLAEAVGPVRTPAMPDADMWARWCMPIRHNDRLLGFLWVLDPDHTVDEDHLPMLVACAELAAETMATARRTAENTTGRRDELISRLLVGPDQDAAQALARLEALPTDTRVQVYAPALTDGWPLPDSMSAHAADTSAPSATSGSPLPLAEMGEAVRRATATRRAVAAGARIDPLSWDALGAWRLIIEAPESLSPSDIHPGVAALARQPNTTLMTTAREILDHGGDIAVAAKMLHLHRTTLYYRIDRILELTGVDLRSGPTRIDLQLALWLAAYRGTADPS